MLAILDVDTAVDGLDHLGHMSHGMSGEAFMGLLIGLTAVLLIFGTPIIIVLAAFRNRTNKQRLINELALKLAEKGHPIPPELFMEHVRQKSDLRRGVIWAAVGLGVVMFGAFNDESGLMGIGCIPLMIGVGFAVSAWLENKQKAGQL
jgi:hypothetical protein